MKIYKVMVDEDSVDVNLLEKEIDKSECQKWFDDGWFAEKQNAIDWEIDKLNTRKKELEEQEESTKESLDEKKSEYYDLEYEIEELKGELDGLNGDIGIIEETIEELENL